MKKDLAEVASLCRTIACPKRFMSKDQNATPQFAQYLAEEIEIACGCGTDSRLVVCAERKVLKELRKRLSRQVQQVIVGTVEQNLCQASPGVVTDRLSDLCLA